MTEENEQNKQSEPIEEPVEAAQDDDYSEIEDEEYEEEDVDSSFFEESPAAPTLGVMNGTDVTTRVLDKYRTEVDEAQVKAIRKEWKKQKKNQRPSILAFLLLVGVAGYVPYYVYQNRDDISYFFSSSEAISLGNSQDYRLASKGETQSKEEKFEDNRYSEVSGIPIHHIGIQKKDSIISGTAQMLVYEMMGSSIYVQEPMENSRFASFMQQTSPQFGSGTGIEPLKVSGRLRRFDETEQKKYQQVRDYYNKKYGTVFCDDMSPADRKRKTSLLGKGGVALQIMPDGAVIQSDTSTHATLRDVEALKGRSAMAVGDENVILHSIDGGLTWRKAELPIQSSISTITDSPDGSLIVFGGTDGWVGGESYKPSPNALTISQDILDATFTNPEPGDVTSPRMIAVGREGLIETAYSNREGWTPSRIDTGMRFNAVLREGDQWFTAGALLMHRREGDASWTRDVAPESGNWYGLTKLPGAVVATGSKGAVARYDLKSDHPRWETWPSDDVPGIDYEADLYASAVSDDGKTWVGVGSKGAIVVSKAGEDGQFGPIQRITGSYASYGVIRDIIAGNSVEAALFEALKRNTQEDIFDVTYHDGTFYAVGSESLLLTSQDGLSWSRRELHVKHRALRTIAFTGPKTGVIAGEKGTMLITEDNAETWRTRKAPSERSIYDISVSKEFGEGFVFAGAYGLWGFCEAVNGKCYIRSRNDSYHYRSIAMSSGEQKAGYLKVVLAGDDSHIDRIEDAPADAGVKTSLWEPMRSVVYAMAIADRELPLRVDSARGSVGLAAVGDGTIYRSMDAGYTFHREETGLTRPIHKIEMSKSGDLVWAFDHEGKAIEDLYGNGQWHLLPDGIIDGTITGAFGYLIDKACVYRKMPTGAPEKLSCAEPGQELFRITSDGNDIYLGVKTDKGLETAVLTNDKIVMKGSVITTAIKDAGNSFELLSCHGQVAGLDGSNLTFYEGEKETKGVSDASCIDGKFVQLSTEKVKDGVWRLKAGDFWSSEVGFDPTHSKFSHHSSGKWWIGNEAESSSDPLILMSKDGKKWSWRRDRITDYHAVATAGSNAVAVGDNASILYSEDYGATWTQVTTRSNLTLRDVCLSEDGSFGIAVGDNGLMYRSQNSLSRWAKLKYNLDFDITSCTIAEQKDRFQIYFAGEGGAIYTTGRDMSKLELIPTDVIENIYSLTTLETGEVLAVGGVYQDPSTVCEEGYIIEADVTPHSLWKRMALILVLIGFWCFTIYKLFFVIRNILRQSEGKESFDTEQTE